MKLGKFKSLTISALKFQRNLEKTLRTMKLGKIQNPNQLDIQSQYNLEKT